MKKILFFIAVAGLCVCSCGNKTQQNTGDLDSTEMMILEDSIVGQLDSMASELATLIESTDMAKLISAETIKLTDEQLKVKPDYLITEADLKDVETLQQKYVAMAYLSIDNTVQQLYYSEDDEYYNTAMTRFAAETEAVNAKKADEAANAPLTINNVMKFYEDMRERNRLDKFYVAQAAYAVEGMYIISRNPDMYMSAINDDAAVNLYKQLQTAIRGVDVIAENHADMAPLTDALAPLKSMNVENASQLKDELVKLHETIASTRAALLK